MHNPALCKATVNRGIDPTNSDSDSDHDSSAHNNDSQQPPTEQVNDIRNRMWLDDEPNDETTNEHDTHNGRK